MTSVLLLDDMQVRADIFRSKFPELIWVDSSAEAIDLLGEQDFDLVCLDYDLASPKDTGMSVVDWLCRRYWNRNYIEDRLKTYFELREAQYVVHSTNLFMGTSMVHKLLACGYHATYVPFTPAIGGPFNK